MKLHAVLCAVLLAVSSVYGDSSSSSDSDSSDQSGQTTTSSPACPTYAGLGVGEAYGYDQSIEITNDQLVDTVTMYECMVVMFDLQIEEGFTCTDGWCGILRIGDQDDSSLKFPFLAITENNEVRLLSLCTFGYLYCALSLTIGLVVSNLCNLY